MLAVFILPALLALALGDPLPPVKTHTEIIHLPAPKPQLKKVPALQEHARVQVQHVPIRQTVVKTIDVPRDIIREVPVIVEKKLILRQPHIRKFPIDVKKVLLQPHIKHVPQVRVNYRKRPYDVWHTKEVKKFIDVPRPVPVIKHKIITKVLNRIVDVPHKVYKDKVKVVQVPQPFKVQKVHHRKIDVPIEVRVPVPRVHIKQTQEVQKVPIDVTVVKKVAIPKRTTLTEIVPVPVKPEGCGPDGVNCGSLASVNSVAGAGVGLARVVERQDVVVDGAPGGVVSDTLVGGAAPGALVTESVGFRGGPIVDVGVGSIGSEFGPGIGPGFGSDLGPGFGGEFYPNGPRFGDGPDATFVESSLAGGSSIGLSGLGPPLDGEFGYVEGAGVGGRRSDLVSIRHTERVVPVPLTGGVSSQGGFGQLGDGYVDGPYPGPYPGDYPGGYPGGYFDGQGYLEGEFGSAGLVGGGYFDGQGYLEGEFGSAGLVGGGGSGFDRGSGFDTEFSGSGFEGGLGGRFETVSGGGGGGGGGGSNAGVFYQETRNALPLQVTGTVRGEYVPTAEDINRVM